LRSRSLLSVAPTKGPQSMVPLIGERISWLRAVLSTKVSCFASKKSARPGGMLRSPQKVRTTISNNRKRYAPTEGHPCISAGQGGRLFL
jgi:hypothetical protein